MGFISSWTQGIIISVTIATIIEMILPNGNSKKYIKMLLGMFIIFNIITPVISKITGKEFKIKEIQDIGKNIYNASAYSINKIDLDNNQNIKEIYILNLKKDIKSKIEDMGYSVINIQITAEDDENYKVSKISLNIKKCESNKNDKIQDKTNNQKDLDVKINKVEDVDIGINININTNANINTYLNSNVNNENKKDITNSDIEKIKEFLYTTYGINKKVISVNN